MRRVAIVLGVVASLAATDAALACGQLKPAQQARAREGFEARLDGADRVLRGRWIPDASAPPDEMILPGRVEYQLWGKVRTLRATSTAEFMPCSYFMYPTSEVDGLFYLERTGPDAYRIIHFE